jgi:hypothetical protein
MLGLLSLIRAWSETCYWLRLTLWASLMPGYCTATSDFGELSSCKSTFQQLRLVQLRLGQVGTVQNGVEKVRLS